MTHDPRTDAELVAAHQEGDPGALSALLARHRRRMQVYAAHLMPGALSDIEDVVQEASIRVMGALDGLRVDAAFGVWLDTVVRNVVFDEARRGGMRKRFADTVANFDTLPRRVTQDGARGPEPLCVAEEIRGRVHAALAELPLWQARTIRLAVLAELPHAEVAEILGLANPKTVKTRVYRARAALAPMLADLAS